LPQPEPFQKKDQCGILAQNFLLCGKLRLEILRDPYSDPEARLLSSAALVTAARMMQSAREAND
jgi:hypothetical protein